MEHLKNVTVSAFHDDGVVTLETENGLHSAKWNGSVWVHSYVDGKSGVFIGALDPAAHGGPEGVRAILRGERPLPAAVSPVADVWFDLGTLRLLDASESFQTILRGDAKTLESMAQVLWESLALCALANAAEDACPPNQTAMLRWSDLPPRVRHNYVSGALELMKFLASFSKQIELKIEDELPPPPWRKYFPLSNPAPDGYEAHILHEIITSPPLPRA